ncbi:hypothetical protein [Bacteriovorax sp. Seq25_V]|uniref:hypothetical protein n=1 Tax=Bacteriovorax sp. Seq25_V TaxID=1201288 RepID=UPI00038A1F35|nr:hypothetical protein [Bacteriovorax sp. Seq25_V]EQC43736.1 hypothetical protein M900_1206 [Bacteriovorax sp. Seq25_V]
MKKLSLIMISLFSLNISALDCSKYEAQIFGTVLESATTVDNREFNCQYKVEVEELFPHVFCSLDSFEIENNLVFDYSLSGKCLKAGESFSGYIVKDGLGIIFLD